MVKVGLFGIGLDTYWSQFDGLLDKLNNLLRNIESRLVEMNVDVVSGGMVDNPFKANDVAKQFNREDVDCVFLFISTYALSQNVLPLVQKVKKPLVLLNLQPTESLDYDAINALGDRGKMTGEWLSYCQSCVAPELASVLNRANIKFDLITGHLFEPYVWSEVQNFIDALHVVEVMKNNRVGVLGHYYNGMLDVYSDLTQQSATFGNHFEILEFGALKALRETVTECEISDKIVEFNTLFDVSGECEMYELQRAARTSVALDKFVANNKLGSLAYYYEGEGDDSYQDIVTSLIPGFTVLTGKNVPVAGECEVKNVQAMKILDTLGCGGSFSEFFALDFKGDVVLLGHDGPAHFRIAEGKVGLVPLPVYHGKPGKGLSIQMKVASSDVTILSVCQNRQGEVYFLTAEGKSVDGSTLNIGNTNSRYKFPISAREFTDKWSLGGPSHHCAIGIGHKAKVIAKVAELLNIKCIQVC